MINIDTAFENSYRAIVLKEDVSDIISNEEGIFIHNPAEPIKKISLEQMLEYFTDQEDYEKCILIKILIQSDRFDDYI